MVCPQTHQSYSAAAINRLLRHLLRLAHEEWEELVSVPRIKLEREPQGRLRWLTLDRVDLSRGVIRLELTKSGRRREVPLNDDSYRALVALEPKPAGRVFQTRSIRTAFENAVETASLDDVTFHTMRHTFASMAMMRGVSLRSCRNCSGTGSLAMTKRYAHPGAPPHRCLPPGRAHARHHRSSGASSGARDGKLGADVS
jgi:integrase